MNQEEMGKLIARLRKEKKLTQEELGRLLGVSGKSVSKWERGTNTPDISLLNSLSEILGVEIGALLKGEINEEKIEQEKIEKLAQEKKERKRRKKKIIFLIVLFVFIIIYSTLLITITKKITENEFYTIRFHSSDEDFSISGKLLYTNDGGFVILDNLVYQGEGLGTDKEPLAKSIQIFLKIDEETILGCHFDEVIDDYGNAKSYFISDILKEFSNNAYEYGDLKLHKDNQLTLNLTYRNDSDDIINYEMNLDVISY